MFTGIIKKTSKVAKVVQTNQGMSLEIVNNLGKISAKGGPASGWKEGESIAVNGVCLTARKVGKNLAFECMPETLKLANLGLLQKATVVNLEKAMRADAKLDGHIVLGHVDTKAGIVSIKKEGNSRVFEIQLPKDFKKLIVYKGSVAVEGISLTVAKVLKDSFVVKIIPYTLSHTNLSYRKIGDAVNLEFDILAKYAIRQKAK